MSSCFVQSKLVLLCSLGDDDDHDGVGVGDHGVGDDSGNDDGVSDGDRDGNGVDSP